MRLTCVVIAWATGAGCKPGEAAPKRAGVSTSLAYPVLLIGQSSLDVRDSEDDLTSIRGASSLNLNERMILDSQGRLFKVNRARLVEGQQSVMLDMGTRPRRYFVDVTGQGRPSWKQIESLVLEQVCSPTSTWAGNPRAVERVHGLKDAAALIEASREAWDWAR